MLLSEMLQNRFRADIRWRGQTYLNDERVALIRVTPGDVFGSVRENDSTEFSTQLSRTEDDLKLACTCKLGSGAKPACKHIWATILAVEAGGLLSGDVRPGHVPPFLAEPDPAVFSDDDLLDGLVDGFDPHEGGSGTSSRRRRTTENEESVQVQPRLRPWEQRLVRVRESMLSRTSDRPVTSRQTQVFFEIDISASVAAGTLVVQTSHRQRRSDGQWGKLKALKVRVGRLDDITHGDDRRILSYLIGGSPERSAGQAAVPELQGTLYRYKVPAELCEVVLPLMAGTGRLRYLGDKESSAEPLSWDAGTPWELCVRVSRDD
ncbi:MAG: helicase SNF2, partial [Planctomycetaceae bacterium]|nr:helicase SNF2 [Planctomycetaceae bacterium]